MPERVVVGASGVFEARDRDSVHAAGTWHYCVHLFAVKDDRVYLQRRAKTRPRNPDRWTSTVSGHITAEDASFKQRLMINQHAALVALDHETREELRTSLDVHRSAKYLGEVNATSEGGGETCNCTTFVFKIEVEDLPFSPTNEVIEVADFPVATITAGLAGTGLIGSDGNEHRFADNFASVFQRLLNAEEDR